MKGPAPIIYFVAPEANSAATRKLKGSALAYGVPLKIVSTSKQLPSVPEPNSVLIMPESMKIARSDNHDNSWQKIFLISSDASINLEGSSKLICVPGEQTHSTELKILHGLFTSLGIKSKGNWHAASVSGECKFEDLPNQLASWLKLFKISSYDSVTILLKSMNSVASVLGKTEVEFAISFDGHSLEFCLKAYNSSIENQKIIADLTTCPSAHLIVFSHEVNSIKVTLLCDISQADTQKIRIIENSESESLNDSASGEREAS